MIKLWLSSKDDIFNINQYFNLFYREDWITDDFAVEAIKEIDKSEVIDRNLIISPVLGHIPPEKLSGGVKALLIMRNEKDKIVCENQLGENCMNMLVKLSKIQDVEMTIGHMMLLGEDKEFEVEFMDTGKIVYNQKDYVKEYVNAKEVVYENNDKSW